MVSTGARLTANFVPTANWWSDHLFEALIDPGIGSTHYAPGRRDHFASIAVIGICARKTSVLVDEDGLRKRLIDGDDLALGEVYDRFSRLVYGLSLRITRDRSLAEEVTQETFLALWEAPAAFDAGVGSLRAWLCTIAHRRSVDAIRRNEAHKARQNALAGDVLVDLTTPSSESAFVEDAGKKAVRAAVDELPAEQRQALWLAYFEGLTFRQVAEVLNIPEGTAKSRIRMATARLASLLREYNPLQLEEESL